MSGPFAERLFAGILRAAKHREPELGSGWQPANGWRMTHTDRIRDRVLGLIERAGFARPAFSEEDAASALAAIASHLDGLAHTDRLLADDRSREILVQLLVLRVLGPLHAPAPVPVRRFWEETSQVEAAMRVGPGAGIVPETGTYEVPGRDGPIRLIGLPTQVVEFFVLDQYALHRNGVSVAPEGGDVVLDGGSGMGDTALLFADRVGPDGRVACCEFDERNLVQLRRNVEANPALAERVQIVEHPLWDVAGDRLTFTPAYGRTTILAEGDVSVLTTTVDALIDSGRLPRIDFLKLDIEGAEERALKGALATLERFRPKLAISAYHFLEDLVTLPRFVTDLGLDYELYLDHFTPSLEETVMFARAQTAAAGS